MASKKALLICYKSLKSSRRSYRETKWLCENFEVHSVGYEDSEIPGVKFYLLEPAFKKMPLWQKAVQALLIIFGFYKTAYNRIYKTAPVINALKGQKFDLVIVHDIRPYMLLEDLHIDAPVICDAHEYYYDMAGDKTIGRFIIDKLDRHFLKKYFERQLYIITVGNWIANRYRQMFPSAQVEVITSAAEYADLRPSTVNPDKIRIIHHGLVDPNRNLAAMIEVADFLDERFQIDLMLINITDVYLNYYEELKVMCSLRKNVRIIPPVKPLEIITFSSQYDIGLAILPENILSFKYCLPNKFFEFVQSRLMLAVSPNPEMAKIVKDYNLGVVSDTYEPREMAEKLNALTADDITRFKANTSQQANALSAEAEKVKFLKLVNSIIKK